MSYDELANECNSELKTDNKCCKELNKRYPDKPQSDLCLCTNKYIRNLSKDRANEALNCLSSIEDTGLEVNDICKINSFRVFFTYIKKDLAAADDLLNSFSTQCAFPQELSCWVAYANAINYNKTMKYDLAMRYYEKASAACTDYPKYISAIAAGSDNLQKLLEKKRTDDINRSFGENYNKLAIGMSKKKVLNILNIEPTHKKAISLKSGVFECWRWDLNSINTNAVVFLGGTVVVLGNQLCPSDIFGY